MSKRIIKPVEEMNAEEIIRYVGYYDVIVPLYPLLFEYYDDHLPLVKLINNYAGYDVLCEEDTEVQIHCPYPEHGGPDAIKSCRFYNDINDKGKKSPKLWCFKCQISRGSLSLSYVLERCNRYNWSFIKHLNFLDEQKICRFPRELVLSFDVTKLDVHRKTILDRNNKIKEQLKNSLIIRNLRESDKFMWIEQALCVLNSKGQEHEH